MVYNGIAERFDTKHNSVSRVTVRPFPLATSCYISVIVCIRLFLYLKIVFVQTANHACGCPVSSVDNNYRKFCLICLRTTLYSKCYKMPCKLTCRSLFIGFLFMKSLCHPHRPRVVRSLKSAVSKTTLSCELSVW